MLKIGQLQGFINKKKPSKLMNDFLFLSGWQLRSLRGTYNLIIKNKKTTEKSVAFVGVAALRTTTFIYCKSII